MVAFYKDKLCKINNENASAKKFRQHYTKRAMTKTARIGITYGIMIVAENWMCGNSEGDFDSIVFESLSGKKNK